MRQTGRKKEKWTAAAFCLLAAGLWCQPTEAADAAEGAKDADMNVYDIGEITVEAKRPNWEEKLSPGTVTVIRPEEFKGEQKTLPDFLKMVPGVHVREVNGKGQYTTVTMRGSTAAQVGVFIDGVLTNLGGDAAVDISTIPVKNVERIEVYRGYIPARFGGTFMGGVINIVTKKPGKAQGSAELGVSSYGGQKGGVEVSAPLGGGSLLFAANHEASDGDFPYENYAAPPADPAWLAMRQDQIAGWEAVIRRYQARYEATTNPRLKQIYLMNIEDRRRRIRLAEADIKGRQDNRRWRKYNDYRNDDVLLKWQDKDWMLKYSWKRVDRHLPDGLWGGGSVASEVTAAHMVDLYDIYWADSRRQTMNTHEFLLQRRYQIGRADFGWRLDYQHQAKKYRVEHFDIFRLSTWERLYLPFLEWSQYTSNKYNAQIDGSIQLDDRQMLDFQMNYSRERLRLDGSNLTRVLDDTAATQMLGQVRNRYDQNIFNAQIQDTITLDKDSTWFLTPSLRYNRSTIIGYSDNRRFKAGEEGRYQWIHPEDEQTDGKATWQIGLKKIFNKNFTMRMTGGTYYRLLNMVEIAGDGAGILPRPSTDGRSSVFPQPEEGKQFDVSAIWDGRLAGADAKASLTWFWRSSDRMLQLTRYSKDYWVYLNENRGRVNGFELQTDFRWKKFGLSLSGTYQDLNMEINNSLITGAYLPIHPTYQPKWEGNLRLEYMPIEPLMVFAEVHYTGEYFTSYENLNRVTGRVCTPLTVLNMGLKWQPRPDMQFLFGCNDVFNRGPQQKVTVQAVSSGGVQEYITANPEYPLQGRTFFATFRYAF